MGDYQQSEKDEQTSGLSAYINKALMNTLSEDSYFKLNQQALSSLDIIPKLKYDGTPDTSSVAGASSRLNTTLYSVLNKCRTVTGQRLLATWIQHPLISKEKIDLRLDIVQHFVENNQLRVMCYDDYLRKIPDLLRISYKINREKCTLLDLMKVYNSIKNVQNMYRTFEHQLSVMGIKAPDATHKLFKWSHTAYEELREFVALMESTIEVDSVDESGEYMIKASSDEDIAKLSLEINSFVSQARKLLGDVAYDIGLEKDKSLKLETDAEKGFGFKVTKQNEQAVRGNNQYEQLSTVKKDGYRFTNRTLTKLSTKYVNAKQEYNALAKTVIEDIISRATIYDNEVMELSMAITVLDVLVALATASVCNNYVRPLILDSDSGEIDLQQVRHPCVENQPDIENYVPNDVSMSKYGKKLFLVTGPNMGGKSTFIKTVAVNIIMAQCGCLIPAEYAKVSIVDGVFTRVGAGDKQMEGVSTFMEEMLDMATILKKSTEKSLVIIDELGRGTSTFDGFGLAWAITKHLATEINCFTLFATHFHELTEMEEEVEQVGNLHVKALCQADKLTMLYNVVAGICDESYGINVAQYTKFPEHVIESAKNKLKEFEEVVGFSDKKEVRELVKSCLKAATDNQSN